MFDRQGLWRANAPSRRRWLERMRQLIYFSSRRLYLARQKRTTFEARDRPYVTILKSVPSHPCYPEPTLKFSPRQFARMGGAHLCSFPIFNCRLPICSFVYIEGRRCIKPGMLHNGNRQSAIGNWQCGHIGGTRHQPGSPVPLCSVRRPTEG